MGTRASEKSQEGGVRLRLRRTLSSRGSGARRRLPTVPKMKNATPPTAVDVNSCHGEHAPACSSIFAVSLRVLLFEPLFSSNFLCACAVVCAVGRVCIHRKEHDNNTEK